MELATDISDLLTYSELTLWPDSGRTITRPFLPMDPDGYADPEESRPDRITERVLSLPEPKVKLGLDRLMRIIRWRSPDFERQLLDGFEQLKRVISPPDSISEERKQLIAAYFCAEYSFEAAALFNPSMIPHPAGAALPDGRVRFLLALRAVGEGHVSSVTFRTGSWGANSGFAVDAPSSHGNMLRPTHVDEENGAEVTWLACETDCDISEMVLFPTTPSQRQGIEDMRLVHFVDDQGRSRIYGTYTAFDGRDARPELLEGHGGGRFSLRPLRGCYSTGKGMALFPRKVGGRYLTLARQDNENIWLLESDDIHVWDEGQKLLSPEQPWEFVQLGNCGSPIEIDEGWLVLTHGVGVVQAGAVAV